MKDLSALLEHVNVTQTIGQPSVRVTFITEDSRKVEAGCAFVAITGFMSDGHQFIPQAVAQGASVIVCETLPQSIDPNITYVQTPDSAEAIAFMAAAYYDYPAHQLTLFGVTGTNGKSTTATLLFDLFRAFGYKCGLISTVEVRINDQTTPSILTTPGPLILHKILREMVDEGCTHTFMEVSSHALAQQRVAGLKFKVAVFTNITHEHLDFHKTFQNYIKAKKKLFDLLPSDAVAITNIDDKHGRVMVQNTKATIKTYALEQAADYQTRIIEQHIEGSHLEINGKSAWFRLTGTYNAYNITAIYAAAIALGLEANEVIVKLSDLHNVRGRFQILPFRDNIYVIIDYAHSPDALENILKTVRELKPTQGRLVVLFGCGGNRDVEKRPIMGRISVHYADKAWFTTDCPRFEEPEAIINEMLTGVSPSLRNKVSTEVDRKLAIDQAIREAQPGDIIIVAGKGHERWDNVRGQRIPHSDEEEVLKAFNKYR